MNTLILIISCIIGIIAGLISPIIPYSYSKYTAVAIMAALDSVIGGISGISQNKFDIKVFISGFFTNSIVAILLTMFGESLDIDIFLAAIFVFVFRIFNNIGIVRRGLINKISEKKKQ